MTATSFRIGLSRALCSCLLLHLVGSSGALATTFQLRTIDELIQEATLIIQGTVRDLRPGDESLTTVVVISVQASWKHRPPSPLRLVLPAGTSGSISQEVPGLPSFRVGEDVILFLGRDPAGQYHVLNGRQGKLTVRMDVRRHKRVAEGPAGFLADLDDLLVRLQRLKGNPP